MLASISIFCNGEEKNVMKYCMENFQRKVEKNENSFEF